MKKILTPVLLLLSIKLFSQVNDSPYFDYQWHETEIINSVTNLGNYDLKIECYMEPWTQDNLQGEETWNFKTVSYGDTLSNDTIFDYPDYLIIQDINNYDNLELCWTFKIWNDYPNNNVLDPTTIEECYNINYEFTSVNDIIQSEVTNNNKIYDISGKEIMNIESVNYGQIYIKNGKKYIKM